MEVFLPPIQYRGEEREERGDERIMYQSKVLSSPQEKKGATNWLSFLSAAQPTDQGEESVVLVVVVVGGGTIFQSPMYSFFGV